MENESVKSFSRPCFSPGSSTTNLAEIDINDPISAYFRKRCSNSSRTFFTKNLGSDSDSSIGVIDVDSVSVFGDEEENDNENFKLMRKSFPVIERVKDNKKAERNKQYSDVSSTHIFDSELQLEKQRVLAQIALKTINDKNNETLNEDSVNGIEKSSENQVLIDLASKFNANLEISKETRKNWFRPNYSPDTPRYFNDELSSIGGEDSALAKSKIKQSLPQAESCMKTRHSKYTKNMNSILKELNQNDLKADLEFKAQTKGKFTIFISNSLNN